VRLRHQDKEDRREHAQQVRDLETTVRAYANQIQALALRNSELTDDNTRLRQHLGQREPNVTSLTPR